MQKFSLFFSYTYTTTYIKLIVHFYCYYTRCLKFVDIEYILHWRGSHCAVTHVRNKNSDIQRRSPNVEKRFSMP